MINCDIVYAMEKELNVFYEVLHMLSIYTIYDDDMIDHGDI